MLVVWTAPSHYLNQWWSIVNWTFGNRLQWNVNRNSNIFIEKIYFKISSGKCRPFCLGLNVLRCLKWPFDCFNKDKHNCIKADSRFAPSQWETALLCNNVSHFLGASLESALCMNASLFSSAQDLQYIKGDSHHMWIFNHLPLDKMATIMQTIFSDAFSWMKFLYFN